MTVPERGAIDSCSRRSGGSFGAKRSQVGHAFSCEWMLISPLRPHLRSGQRSGWGTDARAASAGIPLVLNRLDQCPHGKSTGNLHLGAVCLWRKWGRASRRENEVSCRRQDGPWLLKVNVGRARDNEKRNVHAMRVRNLPEFAYIKAGTVLIRSCRDDGDPRRDSVTLLSRDAVGL